MIQCDFQGPDCKIWYHANCVGTSKSCRRKWTVIICPVCCDATVSAKTVEVTFNFY